jgi:hypothetical protein
VRQLDAVTKAVLYREKKRIFVDHRAALMVMAKGRGSLKGLSAIK